MLFSISSRFLFINSNGGGDILGGTVAGIRGNASTLPCIPLKIAKAETNSELTSTPFPPDFPL